MARNIGDISIGLGGGGGGADGLGGAGGENKGGYGGGYSSPHAHTYTGGPVFSDSTNTNHYTYQKALSSDSSCSQSDLQTVFSTLLPLLKDLSDKVQELSDAQNRMEGDLEMLLCNSIHQPDE